MLSAYCGFTSATASLTLISAMKTPVTPPTIDMSCISSMRFSRSASLRGIWKTRCARSPVLGLVGHHLAPAPGRHSRSRARRRAIGDAELRMRGDVVDALAVPVGHAAIAQRLGVFGGGLQAHGGPPFGMLSVVSRTRYNSLFREAVAQLALQHLAGRGAGQLALGQADGGGDLEAGQASGQARAGCRLGAVERSVTASTWITAATSSP